ncbi:TonB-dependent receptor [Winogradskyella sp.]|uniref:SusC/RagA family TonB-linked outer membrane protein n=1 Tax=Winogradskyella sp. TaxID=1883156 RepID=UPI00260814F4|nr:TonB-dependent receptor [Winogradskyella sp.]
MKVKNYGLVLLYLFFGFQLAFTQEKTITGTVTTQSDGLPLPGANVIVKNTSRGVQSDFDGKFRIDVAEGEVLVISYVGMETTEIIIGTANVYDIALKEGNALDEVVVVAYGTQKREAVVGSVQAVGAVEIEQQQVTSPLRALQGSVAGINMITQGGQPGNNPSFVVRGFSSINANSSPLIILDGTPFNGNLNTISQDQIESLTVLKDGASASLYGSRGANGVVIITTKTGKKNTSATVSIRTQYGISNPAVGLHDTVDPGTYLELLWSAARNRNVYEFGQSPELAAQNASNGLIGLIGYNPYDVSNPVGVDGNLVDGANLKFSTDWEDVLLRRNVPRVNHNLSVQGGGERSSYFFSLDYLNEEGQVIEADFERISTRFNFDSQLKDWLKIGLRTSFSRSSSGNPEDGAVSAVSWIYGVGNVFPIYARDANGDLVFDASGNPFFDLGNGNGGRLGQAVNANRIPRSGENIMAIIRLGTEERIRTNYIGNAFAEINFLENFTFRTNLAYENFLFDSHSFDDDQFGIASDIQGRVSKVRNVTTTLNAIQKLNYTNSFGLHSVSVDAIMEAYTNSSDSFRGSGTGLLPDLEELQTTNIPESISGLRISSRVNGYLGRLSYNYDNKYFFETSFRRDGASQFGRDFRWGSFYSVGGSWIVTKENFLSDSGWLDNLKLRASYGELGNNAGIGFFPYQFVFVGANPGNIVISPVEGNPVAIPPSSLPDPSLQWEKTATTNFGLDFSIYRGVLSGTIEYYERESIDLLYSVPAAYSTGATDIFTNNGAVKNSGLEITLNSRIIDTEDVSWNIGGNASFQKNEITSLPQDQFINGTKLWKEGNSLFEFYLREWAGVNPATGDALWYQDITDTNGNVTGRTVTNVYGDATRYETGKESLPDIQGGFYTNFRFKNFDVSATFNYSFGAYLLDTDYSGLIGNFDTNGAPAHPDNLQAWSQPGDITDFPRLTTANVEFTQTSDRWLFKNDYVRLRALTIGYNFSENALKRTGLKKARVYFQGDNILTWQSHFGIDPEQSFGGTTASRSPLPKTFTIGTLLQF